MLKILYGMNTEFGGSVFLKKSYQTDWGRFHAVWLSTATAVPAAAGDAQAQRRLWTVIRRSSAPKRREKVSAKPPAPEQKSPRFHNPSGHHISASVVHTDFQIAFWEDKTIRYDRNTHQKCEM